MTIQKASEGRASWGTRRFMSSKHASTASLGVRVPKVVTFPTSWYDYYYRVITKTDYTRSSTLSYHPHYSDNLLLNPYF